MLGQRERTLHRVTAGAALLVACAGLVLLVSTERSSTGTAVDPPPPTSHAVPGRAQALELAEAGARATEVPGVPEPLVPESPPASEKSETPLAPATFSLVVVDAHGMGIADLVVSARATASVPEDPRPIDLLAEVGYMDNAEAPAAQTTNVDGRIALEVPSQVSLIVQIEDASRQWQAERIIERRLSTGPAGEPIVLEPGETREARLELGLTLAVTGTVLFPGRTPARGANLVVFDADPALFGSFASRLQARTDSGS